MARVRVLSLISLLVCVTCLMYGVNNFNYAERLKETWYWGLLALVAFYGVVSATSVTLLSFCALEASSNGALIVKSDSLYGRLFLGFTALDQWRQFSICRAFWTTNIVLALCSVCAGILLGIVAAFYQHPIFMFTLIGTAVLFILALAGICFLFDVTAKACGTLGNKIDQAHPKASRVIDTTFDVGLSILWLVVALGILGVLIYILAWVIPWSTIWAFFATWKYVILTGVGCVIAAIVFSYGLFKLFQATIGEEFVSFWHKNLCPRIEVR